MADWLHVRPTLRRSCLSSQGQGRPEDFRLALELRLLDSKICHLARPPITFEPLFGPAHHGPSAFYWLAPCSLLADTLTPESTPDTCKAHFPIPTAPGTRRHAQANKARFVSFRCRRCRAHSYALHPLPSLTSRRGRQRSTLPDSLSLNLPCRVSHVLAHSSPSDEQTNNHTRQLPFQAGSTIVTIHNG